MPVATAIIGASGYGGAELLRLLAVHPHFEPVCLIANTQAGQGVTDLYPHLRKWSALRFERLEECRERLAACRLVFCGLPHGEAMRILPGLKNEVMVDLGGDFRLNDAEAYEKWYGLKHACADELGRWAYGLPELFRDQIRGANRIANPGCYATAAILAAAPLLKEGLAAGPLVIDAVSGVSGAGRTPRPEFQFSHLEEDVRAYKAGVHQHTPEIEAALERVCGGAVMVSFTPHLGPLTRGIHLTLSAQLRRPISTAELGAVYEEAYAAEPFVKVCAAQCGTKEVRGSNYAALTPVLDQRCGRVIISCVLDNLVKGAAGQALQNANIRFGFPESAGLEAQALYP